MLILGQYHARLKKKGGGPEPPWKMKKKNKVKNASNMYD